MWSFQSELGCLQVVAVSPANISREEKREVNDRSRPGPSGKNSGVDGDLGFLSLHEIPHGLPRHFSWSLDFSVTVKVRVFVRPQGLWGASASLYLVPRSTTQWVQIGPWLSW